MFNLRYNLILFANSLGGKVLLASALNSPLYVGSIIIVCTTMRCILAIPVYCSFQSISD